MAVIGACTTRRNSRPCRAARGQAGVGAQDKPERAAETAPTACDGAKMPPGMPDTIVSTPAANFEEEECRQRRAFDRAVGLPVAGAEGQHARGNADCRHGQPADGCHDQRER